MTLIALSLIGFLLSIYLVTVHYDLRAEPGSQSACAISATVNCHAVALSAYSTVAGAPLAALGGWFYFMTGTAAAVGLWRPLYRLPRSPALCLLLAGCFATGLSMALAILSGVAIGALCVNCAVLYVVNLAMLVTAWRALRQTGERFPQAWRAERRHWNQHRSHAVEAFVGSVGSLMLVFFAFSKSDSAASSEICAAVAEAANEGKRVSLVMYTDFQCAACRKLHAALRSLRSGLDTRYRYYPLDMTCNPRVKKLKHPGACLQARAAICADWQGRYKEVGDRLFDAGPAERSALIEVAVSVGLDRARFSSCLDADETKQALQANLDAAMQDGVRATPTIFVNGRRHFGRLSEADMACLAASVARANEP